MTQKTSVHHQATQSNSGSLGGTQSLILFLKPVDLLGDATLLALNSRGLLSLQIGYLKSQLLLLALNLQTSIENDLATLRLKGNELV